MFQLFEKIRAMFRPSPTLDQVQTTLESNLHEHYSDLDSVIDYEKRLLEEGRTTQSQLGKRKIAGQIARCRGEAKRLNNLAAVTAKQIEVIATQKYYKILSQQNELIRLPDSTALTEASVAAQERLEELQDSVDMADDLIKGNDDLFAMSDNEMDILAEIGGEVPKKKVTEQRETTSFEETKEKHMDGLEPDSTNVERLAKKLRELEKAS